MENRKIEEKILKNVRAKIVVSNLEREESMKLNKRKQVISVCTAILLVLSGGFLTVNATTDGKLVEDIKDIIVVNLNKDNCKVTKNYDENGEEHVTYTVKMTDGVQMKVDVNKNALKEENIQADIEEGEEGPEINLYAYE